MKEFSNQINKSLQVALTVLMMNWCVWTKENTINKVNDIISWWDNIESPSIPRWDNIKEEKKVTFYDQASDTISPSYAVEVIVWWAEFFVWKNLDWNIFLKKWKSSEYYSGEAIAFNVILKWQLYNISVTDDFELMAKAINDKNSN